MIKWCAYCQTYDGEIAPFEQYTLSHGICKKCIETNVAEDEGKIARAQAIRAFYETMRIAIAKRDTGSFSNIYPMSKTLGIHAADLALGIMQPLLYEVGELWSQGKITVAYEHYYTGVSKEILQMIHASTADKQSLRQSKNPRIVLMQAPGNHHSLGLQFVELILMLHGISSYVMGKNLSKVQFLDTLSELSPSYLGVSAALPLQHEDLVQIGQINSELGLNDGMRIFAGGFAFRQKETNRHIKGIQIMTSAKELIGEMA